MRAQLDSLTPAPGTGYEDPVVRLPTSPPPCTVAALECQSSNNVAMFAHLMRRQRTNHRLLIEQPPLLDLSVTR